MAAITLDRVWLLHPPSGASLALLFEGERQFADSKAGEVRAMVNGRLRAVTRPTRRRGVQVRVSTDSAGLAQLQSWVGQLVLYRDGLGNKLWGVYFDAPWQPHAAGQRRFVDLAVAEITHSEAV